MQVLQLNALNGWTWIQGGLEIFKKNPKVWAAIFFAYLLISISLYFFLPLIGLILFYLVDPLFVGGFMLGCKALESGNKLEISHLFAAFKHNASRLVTLGGINLVGRIIIFGVIGLIFVNSGYEGYLDRIGQGDFEWLFSSSIEFRLLAWLLLVTALMLPLYMAYWFSPALVELDEIEPFDAVMLSLKGCAKNAKVFLLYGLSLLLVIIAFFLAVALIGGILGLITMLLGNGVFVKIFVGYIGLTLALLCWIGVQVLIATTQYLSYKAIFHSSEEFDRTMNQILAEMDRITSALKVDPSTATGHFNETILQSAFQPIVSLAHCRTVGYEGLVRPRKRDGSPLTPMQLFAQQMDEAEAIHLDRLCRALHIQNFVRAADDESWLFLNVSPAASVRGRQYGEFFGKFLEQTGLPAERVVIEVLEAPSLNDQELAASVACYRELGCLIAIDDFGVGHSNFGRVWQLKPHMIKLDRSTLTTALNDTATRRVLPRLVNILHEVGSLVLVEGVENESEAMLALECGADLAQGFYFGHPVPITPAPDETSSTIELLNERYLHQAGSMRQGNRYAIHMAAMCEAVSDIRLTDSINCPAVDRLLSTPGIERCYLLDEGGRQVGNSRTAFASFRSADQRFRPLDRADGARWVRRTYWERALARPDEIQLTRPYLSIATGNLCVTLSTCFSGPNGWLVLCCDLDHQEGGGHK